MSDEPPILAQPTQPPVVGATQSDAPVGADSKKGKLDWLLNNKLGLLGLLFFATAALGLPLIWKSPKFSRPEKIVWSIAVTIYTVVILWVFCAIMWWSYSRIAESMS